MPELVDIPGASFLMGTSTLQLQALLRAHADASAWERQGRFQRERPDHRVTV